MGRDACEHSPGLATHSAMTEYSVSQQARTGLANKLAANRSRQALDLQISLLLIQLAAWSMLHFFPKWFGQGTEKLGMMFFERCFGAKASQVPRQQKRHLPFCLYSCHRIMGCFLGLCLCYDGGSPMQAITTLVQEQSTSL